MKLFGGYELTRATPPAVEKTALMSVGRGSGPLWGILESFAGAWQRNVEVASPGTMLAYSAVFACVSLRANDVAKLRIKLSELTDSGVWVEVERNSPFTPVLRKPNRYQTRIQFLQQWMTSKLLTGNTYVLKDRDARGIVTALYVLDARQVTPLVSSDGDVFYQLQRDYLAGVEEVITIPASEIIHDRYTCLFHPLIGVSPIFACGASATQGIKIQNNASKFFENMSRPSGQLTAPGAISEENAARLKAAFENNFSGGNIGRLLVAGDGLHYEPFGIPASDSQLIEQLKFTVEDVARAFNVPQHKLGGAAPSFNNVGALNQDYYSQTLQADIEAIELLLDEGLALPTGMGTEMDLDGLLRMDPLGRAETSVKNIGAAVWSPNEARLKENLPPVPGGDSCFLQQQYWPIQELVDRTPPAPPSAPASLAGPAPKKAVEDHEPKDEAAVETPQSYEEFRRDMHQFTYEVMKGLLLEDA